MPVVDMFQALQLYEGLWVALIETPKPRVVGSGKTLHDAKEEAARHGYSDPTFCKVPEKASTYIL